MRLRPVWYCALLCVPAGTACLRDTWVHTLLTRRLLAPALQAVARVAADPEPAPGGAAPQHVRRHTRAGSLSSPSMQAGVSLARPTPVLVRHRRRGSLVTEALAAAVRAAPPLTPPQSPTRRQGSVAARIGCAVTRAGLVLISPLLALLGWLLSLAEAVVKAASAHNGAWALCTIGCVIIALQAATLRKQRQQLAQHPFGSSAPLPDAHAAQAVAALGREVASLSRTLQQLHSQGESWRAQLEVALATTADLAQRLQQQQAGASRSCK